MYLYHFRKDNEIVVFQANWVPRLMVACCHNLKLSFNFCALEIQSLHPHLLFSADNWVKAEVHLKMQNDYMGVPVQMSFTANKTNKSSQVCI